MNVKHVLCAVDFSEGSREAMRVAADLARRLDAMLILAHVRERSFATQPGSYLPPEIRAEETVLLEGELATWRAEAHRLGAPEVATQLLEGSPWDQIVSTALDDPAIGLIVLGTHGRTGLRRALIGSVAERVVRHAPCTVMVVRPHA